MKLLKLCQQIEITTGKLYKTWSKQDQFSEELRTIWAKLSDDEEEHAREIQLAINLSSESSFSGSKIDLQKLTDAHDQISKMLVNAQSTPSTEKQALQIAVKLENSLHEAHIVQSLEFTDGSIKKLFSALSSGDKSHYEILKKYLVSKGYMKPKQ